MSTFCQRLYHRKCQGMGVGGQKRQILVNIVCERPLSQYCHLNPIIWFLFYFTQKTILKKEAISDLVFSLIVHNCSRNRPQTFLQNIPRCPCSCPQNYPKIAHFQPNFYNLTLQVGNQNKILYKALGYQ